MVELTNTETVVVTPPRAIRHQREWVLEVQEVQSEKKAMRGRCVAIASEKFHKSLVKHIAASHASLSVWNEELSKGGVGPP